MADRDFYETKPLSLSLLFHFSLSLSLSLSLTSLGSPSFVSTVLRPVL
jgi:hypothetical protein